MYYTEEHSFKVFVARMSELSTPSDLWKFVLDLFIYIHVCLFQSERQNYLIMNSSKKFVFHSISRRFMGKHDDIINIV